MLANDTTRTLKIFEGPHDKTTTQVAEQLGVSRDTVRHWITTGRLRATNVAKGSRPSYRISEAALKDMEKLATEPTRSKRRILDVPQKWF